MSCGSEESDATGDESVGEVAGEGARDEDPFSPAYVDDGNGFQSAHYRRVRRRDLPVSRQDARP
eukprot:11212475-Lingulodinium_polyedra.AAC.1